MNQITYFGDAISDAIKDINNVAASLYFFSLYNLWNSQYLPIKHINIQLTHVTILQIL